MSYMSDLDIQRQNVEGITGPLSTTEADLLALEQRAHAVIEGARRIRYHLGACEHGDAQTWAAFHELLKYAGIHDEVVPVEPITQPQAEMAATTGE